MSEILFHCVIPGRVGIKKNSRKIRRAGYRSFSTASDEYKLWEYEAAFHVKKAMRGMEPIRIPVNVQMIFYFKDHRSESDLSNCYQGPEDLLQEMGVLENDRLIYSHDGSRKVFGFAPKVEITITPYKP